MEYVQKEIIVIISENSFLSIKICLIYILEFETNIFEFPSVYIRGYNDSKLKIKIHNSKFK